MKSINEHVMSSPTSLQGLDAPFDASTSLPYFYHWDGLNEYARELVSHFQQMKLHPWAIRESQHWLIDSLITSDLPAVLIQSGKVPNSIFSVAQTDGEATLSFVSKNPAIRFSKWASQFPTSLFFQSQLLNPEYRAHLLQLTQSRRKAFSIAHKEDRSFCLRATDRLLGAEPADHLLVLSYIEEAKRNSDLKLKLYFEGPISSLFVEWTAYEWKKASVPNLSIYYTVVHDEGEYDVAVGVQRNNLELKAAAALNPLTKKINRLFEHGEFFRRVEATSYKHLEGRGRKSPDAWNEHLVAVLNLSRIIKKPIVQKDLTQLVGASLQLVAEKPTLFDEQQILIMVTTYLEKRAEKDPEYREKKLWSMSLETIVADAVHAYRNNEIEIYPPVDSIRTPEVLESTLAVSGTQRFARVILHDPAGTGNINGIPRRLNTLADRETLIAESMNIHLKVQSHAIKFQSEALRLLLKMQGVKDWKPSFTRSVLKVDERCAEVFGNCVSEQVYGVRGALEDIKYASQQIVRLPERIKENVRLIREQFASDQENLKKAEMELDAWRLETHANIVWRQASALNRFVLAAYDAQGEPYPRDLLPQRVEIEEKVSMKMIYVMMPDKSIRFAVDSTFNVVDPQQVRMKHSQLAEGSAVYAAGVVTFTIGDVQLTNLPQWFRRFTVNDGGWPELQNDLELYAPLSGEQWKSWRVEGFSNESGHYHPFGSSLVTFKSGLARFLDQGATSAREKGKSFRISLDLEQAVPSNILTPGALGLPQLQYYSERVTK